MTVTFIYVTVNAGRLCCTMELTIDQLAQRVGMTVRNIREWQTQGLVPPPERRGRIGVYGEWHIAVIKRVQRLQAEGFPLEVIKRLIDSAAGSENEVRQFVSQALGPFSVSGSARLSRQDLRQRLGEGADALLEELGLVSEADAEAVSITDITTVRTLEDLVAAGMSLDHLVSTIVDTDAHQHEIARLVMDAFADDVWNPFAESLFKSKDWHTIAENTAGARRLLSELLAQRMRKALDDVGARVLRQQAQAAEQTLNRPGQAT